MFRIPTITRNLLLINIIVFLITEAVHMTSGYALSRIFGLHFVLAQGFMPHQLFTYMFMHGGFYHLLLNMFALWMFGCVVERAWGGKRFLLYYILCGLGAGLFQEAAQLITYFVEWNNYDFFNIEVNGMTVTTDKASFLQILTTVGASGCVYGILLAFAMTFPEERIFVIPIPVPIKAKWFVCIYAGIELFLTVHNTNDGVAHIAHLGGMVIGYFLIKYWRKHPQAGMGNWNSSNIFSKLKENKHKPNMQATFTNSTYSNPDWNYNASQKANQEEIDVILDKIRKSGYDSLSKEEKKKLFDASSKK